MVILQAPAWPRGPGLPRRWPADGPALRGAEKPPCWGCRGSVAPSRLSLHGLVSALALTASAPNPPPTPESASVRRMLFRGPRRLGRAPPHPPRSRHALSLCRPRSVGRGPGRRADVTGVAGAVCVCGGVGQ